MRRTRATRPFPAPFHPSMRSTSRLASILPGSPASMRTFCRATMRSPAPAMLPSASSARLSVATRPSAASSSLALRASSVAWSFVVTSSRDCLPLRWSASHRWYAASVICSRVQMTDAAYQRWLADHLSGRQSLLLVTTNDQATELARRARDELAALGLVATESLAELADGNIAGAGDLIVARQNVRIEAGEPGRMLANRDVLRIDGWNGAGKGRVARVRRIVGHGRAGEALWSAPFELSGDYVGTHVQLAYAGNVHVAEGRTSDTSHLVVDETAGRESFYVGMGRARQRNTAYVITERARAADLAPEPRPAPSLEDPGAA